MYNLIYINKLNKITLYQYKVVYIALIPEKFSI